MPRRFASFIACITVAAWLGFAAAEAFHDEDECHDEDCPICFAIQSAQEALAKIIPAAEVFQFAALIAMPLLILAKAPNIRISTPVLCKVRLDL